MCYSAMIERDYGRYFRVVGPDNAMSREDFVRTYWWREKDGSIRIPKAVDAWFASPKTDAEIQIANMIRDFDASQTTRFEQELFRQKKRLGDAERSLQSKPTKKALNEQRIATNKIEWAMRKLKDVRRIEPSDDDARIFPGWYAPVIVSENGRRQLRLMRYQCRPQGKPKFYDTKYPGTYNARRDNLGGFWKDVFGYRHGVMIVNAFFENVSRHKVESRELADGEKEENVVLEFRPRPKESMLVACLWSHWNEGDESLDSFAAITDEPPPEVAAAGHDRCIIPIKEEHLDAWLNPEPRNLAAQYAILDDRARPYYDHRMAA